MTENKTEMSLPQRIHGHLSTVHHHRALVRRFCFKCGLIRQGLMHDLSKYAPAELIPSIRYYQGYRSPYPYEKELKGYSLGWLHHKGHNKHHWEYWWDVLKGEWQPIRMPYRYLIESICDRVAACRTYHKDKYQQTDALEYYLTRKDSVNMHPETAAQMERILRLIAEQGEDAAFEMIRNSLKENTEL